MPDRCAAPGCRSNYDSVRNEGYVQCFQFPKNDLRAQWIHALKRHNWVPGNRAVVCIKHFHESDLEYTEVFVDKSGFRREFRRKKPVLRKGAIPSRFPNLPSYLSSKPKSRGTDPDTRKKDIEEKKREKFARLEEDAT